MLINLAMATQVLGSSQNTILDLSPKSVFFLLLPKPPLFTSVYAECGASVSILSIDFTFAHISSLVWNVLPASPYPIKIHLTLIAST